MVVYGMCFVMEDSFSDENIESVYIEFLVMWLIVINFCWVFDEMCIELWFLLVIERVEVVYWKVVVICDEDVENCC